MHNSFPAGITQLLPFPLGHTSSASCFSLGKTVSGVVDRRKPGQPHAFWYQFKASYMNHCQMSGSAFGHYQPGFRRRLSKFAENTRDWHQSHETPSNQIPVPCPDPTSTCRGGEHMTDDISICLWVGIVFQLHPIPAIKPVDLHKINQQLCFHGRPPWFLFSNGQRHKHWLKLPGTLP